MKVRDLIQIMQDIGHLDDEVDVVELIQSPEGGFFPIYRDIGKVCGVSAGDKGDGPFSIVCSKLPEMFDQEDEGEEDESITIPPLLFGGVPPESPPLEDLK